MCMCSRADRAMNARNELTHITIAIESKRCNCSLKLQVKSPRSLLIICRGFKNKLTLDSNEEAKNTYRPFSQITVSQLNQLRKE
jgi:hypothetical protein